MDNKSKGSNMDTNTERMTDVTEKMTDVTESMTDVTEKVPFWTSYRTAMSLWGFFGTLCLYLLRINFSVAIVCMTYDVEENETVAGNGTFVEKDEGLSIRWLLYGGKSTEEDADCSTNSSDTAEETGEFPWDRELRGVLSSSFFWGYILTQFLGGWLGQIVGGKRVITGGMILSIVMSFLSPVAARISPYALMAARFTSGLGQGVFYPAIYGMAGYWFPLSERAFLLALMMTGGTLGTVLSFAFSGLICAQLGWPWVFYIYSILSVVFLVCWVLFVHDTPALHPKISQAERDFIHCSMQDTKDNKMPPIPWRGLLTDPAMWCLVLSDFCNGWALYAGLTQLPQYMEDVLQVDITKNGLFNSLPYLTKIFTNIGFALLGDYIFSLHVIGIHSMRRIFTTIGLLIPMACVICVGFLDCETIWLAVLLITMQEGFGGAKRAGFLVSRVDMAPQFSGIIQGICNTSANMAGIFAPLAISIITEDGTRAQWQLCFLMSAFMYLVAWLSFMIFGKSHIRPWAIITSGIEDVVVEVKKDDAELMKKTTEPSSSSYINNALDIDYESTYM